MFYNIWDLGVCSWLVGITSVLTLILCLNHGLSRVSVDTLLQEYLNATLHEFPLKVVSTKEGPLVIGRIDDGCLVGDEICLSKVLVLVEINWLQTWVELVMQIEDGTIITLFFDIESLFGIVPLWSPSVVEWTLYYLGLRAKTSSDRLYVDHLILSYRLLEWIGIHQANY